jgi:hypothetical protein
MKPINKMNKFELTAFIQTHLRQKGVAVVLSGGAAVSYYSANIYVSFDVDLVVESFTSRKIID